MLNLINRMLRRKVPYIKKLEKHYHRLPDILPINKKIKAMLEKTLAEDNIKVEVDFRVSKEDIMFLVPLRKMPLADAYNKYIQLGIQSRNLLKDVIRHCFQSNFSFLDFASGYGRLTRILSPEFNLTDYWVSDIKMDALRFQRDVFKVNTIPSSYIPEEFNPTQKFDLIFVGSLFSHLPRDLFIRWLKTLEMATTNKGVLVFSFHNIKLLDVQETEFHFKEISEETIFQNTANSLFNNENYGSAFVTHNFVRNVCDEIGISNYTLTILEKKWGIQDVAVINKSGFCLSELENN